MTQQINDLVIRLTADTGNTVGKFTEVNQGLDLLGKGIAVAREAWQLFAATIERGQAFQELSTAFDNLYGKTQIFAGGLDPLRTALGGLVGDLDMLKSANLAAQAGLSPERFLQVAQAADALGDAVGKSTKDALDDLSRGLALGNERLLKQYGILIDSEKAEAAFAKSIGTTAEFLNQEGKAEAVRIEALKQIAEKQKAAGEETKTAADELQKLNNQWDTFLNNIASAINKFPALVGWLENLNLAAERFFDTSSRAKYEEVTNKLSDINDEIAKTEQLVKNLESASKGGGLGRLLAFDVDKGSATDQLEAAKEKLMALQMTASGLVDYQKDLAKEMRASAAALDDVGAGVDEINNKPVSTYLDKDKIAKAAEEARKLEQAFKDMVLDFNQGGLGLGIDKLKTGIADAIEGLDRVSFDSLIGQFKSSEFTRVLEELKVKYRDVLNKPGGLTLEELQQRATEIADTSAVEMQKAYEEKAKEAFQNSVDFFADILTTTITGSAQDLEQILMDAFKRVAIGFAAEILATMAAAAGINVTGITSAGGLGQWLGSQALGALGLGGGGSGGLGTIGLGAAAGYGATSLFGGGTAAATAVGAGGVPGLLGGGVAGATGASTGIMSTVAAIAPYAVAAVAAAWALNQSGVLNGTFGGTTNAETLARRGVKDTLAQSMGNELTFRGLRGDLSLLDMGYTVSPENQLGQQAQTLLNPLGQIFGKGDDKLSADMSAIFANAVSDAENFNEVIMQSASLMESMGINAEQAKGELTSLFLDGKVTLDEFAAGIHNLNIIAAEDLTGPNSVRDAIAVVADELSTPRAKLKGLELAFKEMAELGIDSTAEIHAYLTEKFGPDVAAMFDQLAQAGFDSFEDIKNAGADQIAAIFSIISPLLELLKDDFASAGAAGAKAFVKSTQPILKQLDNITTQAEKAARGLEMVRQASQDRTSSLWTQVGGAAANDNPQNNANDG